MRFPGLTEGKMAYAVDAEQRCASPIRVFLIDEEALVRAGMRILIDSWPNSKVVGEANIIPEAMTAIETVKPDLIVFSHSGRSTSSLDGLAHLVQVADRAPLVLLTSSRDPKMGAIAVKAGARWVMLKQDSETELRTAIERAFSGEVWINKASGRPRVGHNGNGDRRGRPEPNGTMTNRERDVAVLVGRGYTNRQVGDRLGITEVTVRHHLSSIFNKLGVANRFELIVWLHRNRHMTSREIS